MSAFGKWGDLSGKKFGLLTAVSLADKAVSAHVAWNCVCDCGAQKVVRAESLSRGASTSCGCKRLASTTKHGHNHTKAYGGQTPTYNSWVSMWARCTRETHESYPDYGGRGITVCNEWIDFEQFLKDMGERPEGTTLDRRENDGNYEPSNCKWSTKAEQNQNMRTTKLSWEKVEAIRSDTRSLRKIAADYGVCSTVIHKIKAGVSWQIKETKE